MGRAQTTTPSPNINDIVPCLIQTTGAAWDGSLCFGLINGNQSYLIVMKTDGTLEYEKSISGGFIVKPISQDTFMYTGSGYLWGGGDVNFLNIATNQTTSYPNILTHHDVDYNPVNNTFLTLEGYVKNINGRDTLLDKIVEVDASGNVLWTWDTYDHITINDSSPFNETATVNGEIVADFTHSNAIQWDYYNHIVYLNERNLNTFYKIDQNTGNIIWACGEYGNFTLVNATGGLVSSLWYHCHDLVEVAPNVFSMFDNDNYNETNQNDDQSRMIDVTLNEQTMTAWLSWSWAAPKADYSQVFGTVEQLPNGDRIGDFGTPTKPGNNSIGAVIFEVTYAGQVVRSWTFPVGWEIYRIEQVPTFTSSVDTMITSYVIVLWGALAVVVLVLVFTKNLLGGQLRQRETAKHHEAQSQ
jgi:hypothetical protein